MQLHAWLASESWHPLVNALLLAWLARTVTIIYLAVHNRSGAYKHIELEGNFLRTIDDNPLTVTIIIPAFNEQSSISSSLLSCINSDYGNKEIIVIDDGSTDSTYKVAERIANSHPEQQIKIIRSKCNMGKTEALNPGLNHARGNVVVTLDADTRLEKEDTLKLLIQPFFTNTEIAAITSNLRPLNPDDILGKFQTIEYAKIIHTVRRTQCEVNSIFILP